MPPINKPDLATIPESNQGKPAEPIRAANANTSAPVRPMTLPRREDQEFLPAALEILETPPSPVRMAFITLLAAFVVVALGWMWIGRFDIVAVAQGKFQPSGRAKVIQPIETAKVLRVVAQNGTSVAQDDILVEFDTHEALADVQALEAAQTSLSAEIARRHAAVDFARRPREMRAGQGIVWIDSVPATMRERQQGVLAADIAQLDALVVNLEAQSNLKTQEHQRLIEIIKAQGALVQTLQERVEMRTALTVTGSGSRASVIDGKEVLQKEEAVLAGQKGQLRETEASLKVLASEQEKLVQGFMTDNIQRRAEAERTLDEVAQRLAKARARLNNMTLRSPTAGVVQASMIYTVGQVVTVGQEVMRIVPMGAPLEVEIYVANKDIGFVREGQEVTIKVDSFPFIRYGSLTGRVIRIGGDAVPLPEAAQNEASLARSSESQTFGGAQRIQNLVFPVTISVDAPHLVADGRRIAMTPGMTLVAEIKTGSRRILEYLFSPLLETATEAMRER